MLQRLTMNRDYLYQVKNNRTKQYIVNSRHHMASLTQPYATSVRLAVTFLENNDVQGLPH